MKKVLLLNSPVFTTGNGKTFDINPLPPIGMAYLSTSLKKAGFQVKIVDVILEGWLNRRKVGRRLYYVGLEYHNIKKIIKEYSPDAVGISAMFSRQAPIYNDLAKIVKEVSPKIITIVGGAHTSVDPYSLIKDENVDFILIGEADHTLPQLLKAIENGEDYSKIDGIGYRKDGKAVVLPKTTYITNPDELEFPDWKEAQLERYFGLEQSHGTRKKTRFAPLVTSRGCPYDCVFCSAKKVWGRRYRPRSPENVIKELLWLKNTYGIEEVMIEDDNLTLEPKRAEKIFDLMIENKLNIAWDTPNGIAAWTLNEKLVKKMIKSGCYSINLAIESGNQYHLTHNIRKPVNLEKVKEIVRIIKQYDVDVMLYIVFGVPGETKQTMFDTYKYIAQLGLRPDDVFISIATPYFGTDLYDICKKKNYLIREVTPSAFHIRSYWIKTETLSSFDIKIIMKIGAAYLIYQKAKHTEQQSFSRRVLVELLYGVEKSLSIILRFYKNNKNE